MTERSELDHTAICPACGGHLSRWLVAKAAEPGITSAFEVWRCARCGSARTQGATIPGLHESGMYEPIPPRGAALVGRLLAVFASEKVRILRAVAAPPSSVLDVGAGRGRFVARARLEGYDIEGIEPSAQGTQVAAANGVPVRRASVEAADVLPCSLDVVTLWHVLEHLEDPAEAIRTATGWLKPQGSIIVAVPNLSSVQATIGAAKWFHLDVPRHRTHFTQAGLEALLRAAGLEPVIARHVLLEHNPYGMWQTLVNRITRQQSYLYNALKRNVSLRSWDLVVSLAALPLAPIAAAAEAVAGMARRGGTVVVAARLAPAGEKEAPRLGSHRASAVGLYDPLEATRGSRFGITDERI